jgi:hypothetical protein
LGIELEVESTEVAAGPYSADILARDSATGDYVVVENQLGRTDHDHLGKSITYAAVLNATAVVWVAAEFTEEHKKALDWLNDNSSEDVSYFGVLLELWQIDDSKPAVHFNVISRPAEFARSAAIREASAPLSDARRLQLDWWTDFRNAILARTDLTSARQPRPRYWYDVPLGRSGIHISCTANTFDNILAVRVYMRSRYNSEAALSQLLDDKDTIEEEIGEPLVWDASPEARDKVISISKSADLRHRNRWPEYVDWMVGMTDRFRKTFKSRVRLLRLDVEETDG